MGCAKRLTITLAAVRCGQASSASPQSPCEDEGPEATKNWSSRLTRLPTLPWVWIACRGLFIWWVSNTWTI